MSITLPSTAQFALFQHEAAVEDETLAIDAMQQAADLFSVASGIFDDRSDPFELRLMRYAIMDMAWYQMVQAENKNESYAPHASEHLGSYSYSNMPRSGTVSGNPTMVPFFDLAVRYFLSLDPATALVSMTSENVMVPFGLSYLQQDVLDNLKALGYQPDYFQGLTGQAI